MSRDEIPDLEVGTVWTSPTAPIIGITGPDGAVVLLFQSDDHIRHVLNHLEDWLEGREDVA